jgi:hypothetical protein
MTSMEAVMTTREAATQPAQYAAAIEPSASRASRYQAEAGAAALQYEAELEAGG